jgi:hypothetical protein
MPEVLELTRKRSHPRVNAAGSVAINDKATANLTSIIHIAHVLPK